MNINGDEQSAPDAVSRAREWRAVQPFYASEQFHEDGENWVRLDCVEKWLAAYAASENARLEKWIDDLQSGMFINCVYCGHQYGPNTETPMREALESHIAQCSKHPLSKAMSIVQSLAKALLRYGEHDSDCTNSGDSIDRRPCNCGLEAARNLAEQVRKS